MASYATPNDRLPRRRVPRRQPLAGLPLFRRELLLDLRRLPLQPLDLLLRLLVRRHPHHRRGESGPAILALLGDVVEEREQPIELFLRNRIVLVIVAAGAADGEAEEDRAGRL